MDFKEGVMSAGTDTQPLIALQRENIRLKTDINTLRGVVERLQQTIRALNDIHNILETITPRTDVLDLLNSIVSSAVTSVTAEAGSLLLVDEETSELVFVEVIGDARDQLLGYRMPPGDGIAGWAVENRQPRLVLDARREPLFSPLVDQTTGFQTSSLICVPVFDRERIVGAIEVVNSMEGRVFSDNDVEILMMIARIAALALVRAEESNVEEESKG
jgi:GAF domain-containing protein